MGVSSGTGGRSSREGGPGRQAEALALLGQEPEQQGPERAVEAVRILLDEERGEGPAEAAEVVAEEAAGRALDRRDAAPGPPPGPRSFAGTQRERLLARQEVHELALAGGMVHPLVPALGEA